MKKILLLSCGLIAASTLLFGANLRLAKDSEALADIVIDDNPTAVERTAASELKEHLDIACSANFKIVSHNKRDKNKPAIFVGDSTSSRKILNCQDFEKLEYDSIKIKNDGKNIALCGHPQRGSLYAVYTFLEDEVGVRWWSKNERFIPQKSSLEIGELDISYAPTFKLREALYKVAFDGVFAARLKQNGATLTRMNFDRPIISPEYGGCQNLILFKGRGSSFHSHYEIIPPKKYFKDHPEWFSLIKGKRKFNHSQLCLTNEEMAKEYIKNVKELLRNNPLATSIQVSQNDWRNPCECQKCKAIDDENDSHAGTNIYFANKVAEAIETEFPNVYIDTFAYQYTRKAPKKIKPRKNVLVRLCTIECSFSQPLENSTASQNKSFVSDMKDWAKLTKNLFVWDYVTNFRSFMSPHPNMRVLAPNLRFFGENSASGVFEQGDAFCSTGDFVLLRNWVISHLMWNPYADAEKLFDDFLFGYYGKEVGGIFKEYLNVIDDSAKKSGIFIGCFNENLHEWLDAETFNKASKLLDKATEIADKLESSNPKKFTGLQKKVRRERLSFDHITIVNYSAMKRNAQKRGVEILLPKNPQALLKKLIADWKELGTETWVEFSTPKDFENYQKELEEHLKLQLKILESEKNAKAILQKIEKNKKLFDGEKLAFYPCDIEKYTRKSRTFTFSLADIIEDKKSSTGYASAIPLSQDKQRIQIKLNLLDFDADEKSDNIRIRVFANVRADINNIDAKENAFHFKLSEFWKTITSKSVKVEEIDQAKYSTIELCNVKIPKTDFPINISLLRNASKNINDVYIEKIFVKQN